ncbi:MAG: DMT family transporter [Candidatus Tectomicrobia bacterium]|uniref:DMT family transporter n=1 Tax=Tectimicrobiota bacterium TaxID=2528274 RepID=A0A932HY87_UNCTE|nr:DMT family transporter [Candidatus Tectomicrobia bacterium]
MIDNTAGILWALGAAIMAAFTAVLAYRPLRQMGFMAATLLTNFMNMLVLGAWGWWIYEPGQYSTEGMLWFALMGVTAYSYGRVVFYKALDIIGPPRLMTISTTAPLLSLSLAVLFLGERPGLPVLGGTLLVIAGIIMVSYEPSEGRWVQKGIFWGFASALSLGVSVFLRKKGLAAMPNVGLTVAWSNLVSFPVLLAVRPLMPPVLFHWKMGWAFWAMLGVGFLNSFNQILYNLAVLHGEVSVVGPIISASPVFSLLFTALLLRDTDRIRPATAAGVLVTAGGMAAIALGR